MNREQWLSGLAEHLGWQGATILPSYTQGARSTRVCNLVEDESGRPMGLVSPAIASTYEVGAVVAYLVDRRRVNGMGDHLSQGGRAGLVVAGWRPDRWAVNPAPHAEDRLIARIEEWQAHAGDYPAAPVPQRRRTQTTRMIALTCEAHPARRVRASRSQIEMGYPQCGVTVTGGSCSRSMVEVA